MNQANTGNGGQVNAVNQVAAISCVGFSEPHTFDMCPQNPQSVCSNTYNPSWQNHPNFSWGGNQQPRAANHATG